MLFFYMLHHRKHLVVAMNPRRYWHLVHTKHTVDVSSYTCQQTSYPRSHTFGAVRSLWARTFFEFTNWKSINREHTIEDGGTCSAWPISKYSWITSEKWSNCPFECSECSSERKRLTAVDLLSPRIPASWVIEEQISHLLCVCDALQSAWWRGTLQQTRMLSYQLVFRSPRLPQEVITGQGRRVQRNSMMGVDYLWHMTPSKDPTKHCLICCRWTSGPSPPAMLHHFTEHIHTKEHVHLIQSAKLKVWEL